MNINCPKLIGYMLPTVLRQTLISSFMSVFTSPLRGIHDEFSNWKDKMKIMISGTPQVCMLEKIIKDSLDIDIVISEGDGRPVDFIIQTNFLDVDKERQLFALIDRYRLAGKRYEYKNTALTIQTTWGEYVCEQQTVFLEWTGYLCERKYRPERYIYFDFDGTNLTVEIKEPLASDMKIEIYRHDLGPVGDDVIGPINQYRETFNFVKGFVGSQRKYFPYLYHLMTYITLSPSEDKEYIYKSKIKQNDNIHWNATRNRARCRKKIYGVNAEGYPRTYRLYDEFGVYPSIDKSILAAILPAEYMKRLEAFKRYVESVEIGIEVDVSEAYRENLTACPINR